MAQENESTAEAEQEIELLEPQPPPEDEEKGIDPNAWMVTFSDLVTLLMTFFVLLFAFNDPNPKKTSQVNTGQPGMFDASENAPIHQVKILRANSLIQESLEIFLSESKVESVTVEERERGLIVTLPSSILFEEGGAELSDKARAEVRRMAEHLKTTAHPIRVAGHAGGAAERTPNHRDEWDLSLARANAVLRELAAGGVPPARLSLTAAGRAQPMVKPPEHPRNRRVEVMVLNEPED